MKEQRTFKTDKGTVLPILDLRGKDYLQVAHRLVWFREVHQMGQIKTDLIQVSETHAIAKAEIYSLGAAPDGSPVPLLLAQAYKRETAEGFPDFIEKAETGAIGRALGMAGFGTQFTGDEFDEQDRLADSPTKPAIKPKGPTSNAVKVEPKQSAEPDAAPAPTTGSLLKLLEAKKGLCKRRGIVSDDEISTGFGEYPGDPTTFSPEQIQGLTKRYQERIASATSQS